MEKLNLFFTKIKELTFWQRIFSWGKVRILSYDAFREFKSLEESSIAQKVNFEELKNNFTHIKTKSEGLTDKIQELEKQGIKKDSQIETLTTRINQMNPAMADLSSKLSKFEITKEERASDYEKKIVQINQIKDSLEAEKSRTNDERVKEKEEHFQNMKKQWVEHETSVEQAIKAICQEHVVNYVDEVPFKGNPDNTIEICGEYIIFDAKSPANDDLSNFPKYIKLQTDNVKKYAKQENVKKGIFLVIPSNTIDTIPQLTYNMGDYNVYVIAKDSLEPIILSLKKIEEYEFAEQLSPEDRDNICRIIGRFVHTTKRRIQVDQFFANRFFELFMKCNNDLPKDFLKHMSEFEKSEKLNPPTEKRAKQILVTELREKSESINAEAQIREIQIPENFDDVKKLE